MVHTYLLDAAEASPILAITSPEKRCGKTTLLSLLSALVYRPASGAAFTRAAVYRVIEKYAPTLLIDEADTFLGKGSNDELRGVINSGHTRRMAHVWACVGDNHDASRFSTWAPKAIACIGTLPDTIADRSIEIRMRRRTKSDRVPRYRERVVADLEDLRRKCRRWADDTIETLRLSDPIVPDELSDRAADSWATLLAIADAAGGNWPEIARESAKTLSGDGVADSATIRTDLLRDLHSIFNDAGNPEALSSASLLESLHSLEERPWPTYHRGKELSARGLADLLRPFDIGSTNVRVDDKVLKGYKLEAFDDAFARYLPELSATPLQINKSEQNEPESAVKEEPVSATADGRVADRSDQNEPECPGNGACSVVADKNKEPGEEEGNLDDWRTEMMECADENAS